MLLCKGWRVEKKKTLIALVRVCYSLTRSVLRFWLLRSCVHTAPFVWRADVGGEKKSCQVSLWVKLHSVPGRKTTLHAIRETSLSIGESETETWLARCQSSCIWVVNAWCLHIRHGTEMVWKLTETAMAIRSSGFGLAWKLFTFSSSLCSYQLVLLSSRRSKIQTLSLLGPGFQQLVLQFWKLSPKILTRKLVKSKNCRRNWNRASAKDLL